MELQIGITKTSQAGTIDSRETVELVERPSGGTSIVFCSAKNNGEKDKLLSLSVTNRIVSLIAEGIKDSTAIRTVSDQLFFSYKGQAEANVNVISLDLESNTVMICRSTATPVYYYHLGKVDEWVGEAIPIGRCKKVPVSITELPIKSGTFIAIISEGVYNAGKQYHEGLDFIQFFNLLAEEIDDHQNPPAQVSAEYILRCAVSCDQEQPQDDMCVILLRLTDSSDSRIRKMSFTIHFQDSN